jgi:hypothetical protein
VSDVSQWAFDDTGTYTLMADYFISINATVVGSKQAKDGKSDAKDDDDEEAAADEDDE